MTILTQPQHTCSILQLSPSGSTCNSLTNSSSFLFRCFLHFHLSVWQLRTPQSQRIWSPSLRFRKYNIISYHFDIQTNAFRSSESLKLGVQTMKLPPFGLPGDKVPKRELQMPKVAWECGCKLCQMVVAESRGLRFRWAKESCPCVSSLTKGV